MNINVQFSDATEETIIAYFACAQDATIYPNQGVIETSDARWKAYYSALPAIMQAGPPAPTGN
ncbi:hypothetical protein KTF22_08300 [Burkholderia multivorans]|uniref:hypothetical protein n=1 Tax=Burkholderia multivorans TaxID=87883 RepID=UPI001C222A99|nr:hypothetical protein [Burkholderia multivorans]MBU9661891.1 hypothetical protein [Burkholderia multivorans]